MIHKISFIAILYYLSNAELFACSETRQLPPLWRLGEKIGFSNLNNLNDTRRSYVHVLRIFVLND